MKARHVSWIALVLVLVLAAILWACLYRVDEDTREEFRSLKLVGQYLDPTDADYADGFIALSMGALEGGMAVYFEDGDAAFWVKDDVVHVVNDRAAALTKDLPRAPDTVTYEAVIQAGR